MTNKWVLKRPSVLRCTHEESVNNYGEDGYQQVK